VTRVRLSQIPEDGVLREKGLDLPLQAIELQDPFLGPSLAMDYELRNIHGKILGNFEVRGRMRLECSRCLKEFEEAAETKFLIEFEEKPSELNPRSGLDPEDPELNVVFFSGEEIEFGDEIRQEMELLIPFAPLCQRDCKGLCPDCGANRNEKNCGCEGKRGNNPFASLKQLFQQNKEN
jgi:uncharacterized protein